MAEVLAEPGPVPAPPSIDALARSLVDLGLPFPLLVDAARAAVAAGEPGSARRRADETARSLLGDVVNATGVLLHTNLGRAPLAVSTRARASNVELDLVTGRRSTRRGAAARLVARLTGAEDALVVNNGAAAILLVLSTLASGRCVVVSRGELVEIGGGFRIPEVLEASGARLVEVGTTNRTRVADYESALAAHEDVALVLKVHPSNYRVTGFTESAPVERLSGLGPPVVVDIGSGLLDAETPWLAGGPPRWLAGEPAARQTLQAGASVVTFSGDKLLGGPQAGVIAGRADLVAACARNPLARALRPGRLVLGALEETLLSYLRRDGQAVPFWRMATTPLEELGARSRRIAAATGARPVACRSVAGGGSLPGYELDSWGVAVPDDHTAALRCAPLPVIALVRAGETVCDLRSVDPGDDAIVTAALASLPGAPWSGRPPSADVVAR